MYLSIRAMIFLPCWTKWCRVSDSPKFRSSSLYICLVCNARLAATAALLVPILELVTQAEFGQYCSAPSGDHNVTGHESMNQLRNHKHG